ncbi:transporter substrate-binding domain-containing protein [Vibrio sp. CAIM 722]|uniref:Transporter substrate-binding domain-containing protein n=1 Tax=Vibrio eleionomae TaxID=2653505 RepID=A0A7X4LL27_9VIBR|nr:ABC transporter substrate-binding protein [Vibrio eleionomae]MZI93612.1 transporter substrate-binding domain-containing protein [Vibrio eleionomae]
MFGVRKPSLIKRTLLKALIPVMASMAAFATQAETLKIGYSDWPGWVAWQVAIDKGWFDKAGVDVDFEWFDYSASIDAFAAGRVDAVTMTNGDALVTGASGAKSRMILVTDYSNGNDMIIGKPGIRSIKDLRGKKVAVEKGFVEHLLLLKGLEQNGMKESDVQIVNAKTNELPQVLASGEVSAIGAWQPVSGQSMKYTPGARPIYTSADEPGLIYDALAVNPASVAQHRADWLKVVKVWNKVVAYINDPKTRDDAVKIMAARVGVTPKEYLPILKGTRLLNLKEGMKVMHKGDTFESLYGSSAISDKFNVDNGVYTQPQKIASYIDDSLTKAALK